MDISLSFHGQNSIYWGSPSIHYPARGQAPEIYATLVKEGAAALVIDQGYTVHDAACSPIEFEQSTVNVSYAAWPEHYLSAYFIETSF